MTNKQLKEQLKLLFNSNIQTNEIERIIKKLSNLELDYRNEEYTIIIIGYTEIGNTLILIAEIINSKEPVGWNMPCEEDKFVVDLIGCHHKFIYIIQDEIDKLTISRKLQKISRSRNLLYGRLVRFHNNLLNMKFVTVTERSTLIDIENKLSSLLQNWSDNSKEILEYTKEYEL